MKDSVRRICFGVRLAITPTMTQGISLCMIVKNEEDWVAKAVSSVISIVSEVIIVDTGSTDRTLERVEVFSPKIIHSEWQDHFGNARNISLAAASQPWILVLDADECIAASDLKKLETAMSGSNDGYSLTQRNYVYQNHVCGWEPNTSDYEEGRPYPGFVDNPLIRFFRNDPKLRFQGAVHEIVDSTRLPESLQFSSLPVVIHHFGKVCGEDRVVEKQHLYLKLGEKKLNEDPTNAKAYMDYGIQLQELKQYAKTREPFLKSFEMSGNPLSLLHCAISEKNLGNHEAAGELLDRASDRGLDIFELHLERGNVSLALGDYEKALKYYRICLERSIGNPVATFNMGLAHRKMGELDKAVSYYRRSHHLDPAFAEPALELADVYTDAGTFQEAAKILEDLLTHHPERRDLRLALVKANLQLKRPDIALELLSGRFSGDAVAESLRGAAYLECGDHDRAREHLELAIRSNQSLVDARINISHVYANAGEFVRAARHLGHGFEKTGKADLLPTLSIYEARGGLLEDALPHLGEVISSGQAPPDHWIYRSLILERKEMWSELQEHFEVMADRVPELRDWIGQKKGEPRVAAALSSLLSGSWPRAVTEERSHEA